MSKEQLHKRFTDDQVRAILAKYMAGELRAKDAINYLEVSRRWFYELVHRYENDAAEFSIQYARDTPTNTIDPKIETNILKELALEKKKIIDNPNVPTKRYNYSYIQSLVRRKYQQQVSVPTIINRAKQHGYWKPKPPKKIHDREVLTNYAGELIQHDSSHHLFAPDAQEKWYLITSLDDYSRSLLYADFWPKESSWRHIKALERVFLKYGFPLSYYVDQHSIFRYVKDRDKNSPWATYTQFTDDVDPQWKQVIKECGVKPIYALSAPAKGKIERPYRWLQDHIVRTCVREGITTIEDARTVLQHEVHQYNTKRIHSTTKEIPQKRFRRALEEQQSLFRPFQIPPPLTSAKDLFCLRITRTVDAYRKISLQNFKMKVPGVPPRNEVELRLYPDEKNEIIDVRFWFKGHCTGSQRVKNSDMPIVNF